LLHVFSSRTTEKSKSLLVRDAKGFLPGRHIRTRALLVACEI
jgi:hypothetical protein